MMPQEMGVLDKSFLFPDIDHNSSEEYRRIITKTRQARSWVRGQLKEQFDLNILSGEEFWSGLHRLALLLSSSRGGSSITYELLKNGKLLTLPGETKPLFVLAGLNSPSRLGDQLDQADNSALSSALLINELAGEAGYPLKETRDLKLFAFQVYYRLLLQWPEVNFGENDQAVKKIFDIINNITIEKKTPGIYYDQEEYFFTLLEKLTESFPQIDPRFYDGYPKDKYKEKVPYLSPYQIEEPPFIRISPWHYATKEDLQSGGVLLLKDPSDCWRLPFWLDLTVYKQVNLLHLSRDPRASIHGLIKAWLYPWGYQSARSLIPFNIPGYTSQDDLTENWVNFSINTTIWQMVLQGKKLLEICAAQWAEAHQAILKYCDHSGYINIRFEELLRDPTNTAKKILEFLKLPTTQSLLEAASMIENTPIQSTGSHDPNRWLTSKWRQEIEDICNQSPIKGIAEDLGYTY